MTKSIPDGILHEPITAHMGRDFTTIDVEATVDQALAEIRSNPPTGRIIYFYVVDPGGRLQGIVPTRRLLLSSPEARIREIMVDKVVAIPGSATLLDACEFFTLHRLLAFPVIDELGRLMGTVDVQVYTDEMGELESTERKDQLFQLIGVRLAEAQQASSLLAFRSRFPWLLCNITGGILAAFISGLFEAELQSVVALAIFIPVVLALAESVSIQSVSLSLQSIHAGPPSLKMLLGKLRQEFLTGAMLGIASALLVAIVALAWLGNRTIAVCLMAGIASGVTCAAMIGVATPLVLRLARRDPQVAAGPLALAVADMLTLLLYLSLARWLLMEPIQ